MLHGRIRRRDLCHNESLPHGRAKAKLEGDRFERVEASEEGCTVHDDTRNRCRETLRARLSQRSCLCTRASVRACVRAWQSSMRVYFDLLIQPPETP